MTLRKAIVVAGACLVLLAQPLRAADKPAVAGAARQTLPQVSGPIPVTKDSRPFLGARAAGIVTNA